ncbi:ABC transporter ATP-binding protein [Atopobium fossor]|uniref:ABC transporter ATP-binding protein n=1 Tax=Atopobium fossor TaxID=39487 RepID=UPI00041E6C12|nr:ABC transporter ATP-binding protein [Atopobium fossor]
MDLYKRIFAYVPEKKAYGVLAVFCSVCSAVLTCAGYFVIYQVLREILMANNLVVAQQLSILAIVLLTAGALLYLLASIFSHILGFRLETNLHKRGIDGIVQASFRFFDTNESGIIRKTIDDNAGMTHSAVAHMIPDLGQAFVTPILVIILSFFVSLRVGIAVVVTVFIGVVIMSKMMGGETSFMQQYQDALKRMSGETVEYVRGIQVIKIFKADVNSFKALHEAITSYAQGVYSYSKSCKVPYVTYQWIFLGAAALLVIPIALMLNTITEPHFFMIELLMYIFLLGVVYVCLMRVMYSTQHIFEAKYAVDSLEKLYDEMNKDKLQFGNETSFENFDIAFENMSFSYGDKSVFKNFNLSLVAGKSYALVGSSGSGKSTLAKLLSGFYKVDDGAVTIGKKPLSAYSEDAIIKAISFVFQDPKLFKMSIYDNVALAKAGATHDEVMAALMKAGCADILDKFPERENTLIGAKGVYLSGGEKQRIAIARALLKDAPILVMDEASAAIDADNEYKLQESFKTLMQNKTTIMIAHRLSSIQNVDEILVLKDGEIAERGSHLELLKKQGEYKALLDMYYSANDWRLSYDSAL